MDRRREPMTSQRKKTAPPTPRRPRSSSSGRKGLIAKEKTKKQSVRKRPALDNRFHRTSQMRLTLEPFVSDAMREPCESYPALRSSQHERYVACIVSFAGSQSSPFFH